MFSNRFWILKVALAVGLLAALCNRSGRQTSEIYADYPSVALRPETVVGRSIYLWATPVLASDARGFDVSTSVGPLHVASTLSPPVGEYVTLTGRVTGLRQLSALRVRVMDGFVWKRDAIVAVSIVTVVVFLWKVRRRFRWRIAEGVFRSRY